MANILRSGVILLIRDPRAMGFGYVSDDGPEEVYAKYFKNRKGGLRVGTLLHLISARA
jgi:hypothetical protein